MTSLRPSVGQVCRACAAALIISTAACGPTGATQGPAADPSGPGGGSGSTTVPFSETGAGTGTPGTQFPAGCAANELTPEGGPNCLAECANCNCDSVKYTCDTSCYQAAAACFITADPGGGTGHLNTPDPNGCAAINCAPLEPTNNNPLVCVGTVCKPVKTPPVTVDLCKQGTVNKEPEIMAGYLPGTGQSVSAGGQIKVWITDESSPFISLGEVVDLATGNITTPGNRGAKAPDGYLWEPALYLIAAGGTANTGAPNFPVKINGDFNNAPPTRGAGLHSAGMEPLPAGSLPKLKYTVEYTWNVDALGLSPGTYTAEFVIYDGDHDRGVGCVSIVIN